MPRPHHRHLGSPSVRLASACLCRTTSASTVITTTGVPTNSSSSGSRTRSRNSSIGIIITTCVRRGIFGIVGGYGVRGIRGIESSGIRGVERGIRTSSRIGTGIQTNGISGTFAGVETTIRVHRDQHPLVVNNTTTTTTTTRTMVLGANAATTPTDGIQSSSIGEIISDNYGTNSNKNTRMISSDSNTTTGDAGKSVRDNVAQRNVEVRGKERDRRRGKQDIVAVIGTTGVGKSQYAVDLALALASPLSPPDSSSPQGQEATSSTPIHPHSPSALPHRATILSSDSMQLYTGLPFITNKVTPEEMQGVPHWGLGVVDPASGEGTWEVKKWCEEAAGKVCGFRVSMWVLAVCVLELECGGVERKLPSTAKG